MNSDAVECRLDRRVRALVPKREVFAWECNVRGKDWQRTINHATAGKARYEYLLDLRDAWPDATFADITVRKIGPAHTSVAFRRTATYRGMPDMKCGTRVEVRSGGQSALGVIVGHNDSANFDVLFDEDTYFKGGVGNVHPSELRPLSVRWSWRTRTITILGVRDEILHICATCNHRWIRWSVSCPQPSLTERRTDEQNRG